MGQGPVTPVGHLITKEGSYGFIHVTADGCCKFEDYVGRSYYSLAPEFWSEIEISLPDQEPIRIISPAKVDAFYPS